MIIMGCSHFWTAKEKLDNEHLDKRKEHIRRALVLESFKSHEPDRSKRTTIIDKKDRDDCT